MILAAPIFIGALLLADSSSRIQFKVVVLAALVYLTVASWYHFKDKTLTFEIMIEYILIAALALVLS